MPYRKQPVLTKRQTQKHLDSIETAKVLNKVQNHVLGSEEMSVSQLRAADMLLKRTLPELQRIEGETEIQGAVKLEWNK